MTFMGKTLKYSFFYPLPNTPVEGEDFGTGDLAVVEDVEVAGKFYSIDVGSSYIRFEFTDTGVFKTNGTFNGAVFEDIGAEINAMSRVRLQTNMSGLDRDDITLKADKLAINFGGTAFTNDTYVHLQVIFTANVIQGTAASEVLIGTSGADKIRGSGGDDILRGNAGGSEAEHSAKGSVIGDADWLAGGRGVDRFIFATGDTARQREKADVIIDFEARDGETIDLTEWDADKTQIGDQQFAFLGARPFSGTAGELHYTTGKNTTFVEGDVDGDRQADFAIRLDGTRDLSEANFLL